MVDRRQIQKTIATIEAQRLLLGDAVVNTTVAALQDLLQRPSSRSPESAAQRKHVTVLFAKITGFAGVSGNTQDSSTLNILNDLWQRLDSAITQQGGAIDKHIGDAVMGLFGVPVTQEDDPEQAIRAALRMRAALSDYVADLSAASANNGQEHSSELQNLRLSVGINTGPVMLGRVGDSEEYTVIGDTVNVASRLERAAPPGGILISHDTYLLVRDTFNVEALGPVAIKGRSEPIQVYLVLGVKSRLFYGTGRGVEGVETRMVGRDTEMAGLKAALQLAMSHHSGRAMTILGEAGVGKSRLIHEFGVWVKSLPQDVQVLKGRMYHHTRQIPYILFRELLATFFNIQDNDPASVAREKLLQGMAGYWQLDEDELRKRAFAIAQLIGLDLGVAVLDTAVNVDLTTGLLPETEVGAGPQSREMAYQYMLELLTNITAVAPASLIILEDLHWADEGSLDLLNYILPHCRQMPMLILLLARPVDQTADSDHALVGRSQLLGPPGQLIQLRSLTESQSRELVLQILCKVPEIPDDLSDMIVSRAEGNPLYVEEMVKILIEDGVIIAGQDEWQVQRNQLLAVRVPPHIHGVLQARLDRLSEMERVTLQRAAVVGRVFWDSAVIQMNETAVPSLTPLQTQSALQALEKRELIFRRQISGFAGTQAYVFKHAILHQVAYESVLLRARPAYHKQVGDWLASQSGERIAEYAGLIAEHYEMAGERTAAAELYETAAQRAQTAYDPELAIDSYRKALAMLIEQPHYAEWLLRMQEELGRLLHMRARFVEALQVFMTMRFTAEEDGDLAAQARAWNGLAAIQREQGKFAAMLESAVQAEQVSWLVGAEMELIRALLLQGEAHLIAGNLEDGLAIMERVLQLSDRQEEIVARTQSLYLLCMAYIRDGRYPEVEKCIYQLKQQLSLLMALDELHAAAVTQYALGHLHNKLGQYDTAMANLLESLKLYRDLDEQMEVGRALCQLGETARLRGNLNSAIPFYRKAVSVANGIGYRYGRVLAQVGLGYTLVHLGNNEMAEESLNEVAAVVENVGQMAGWRHLPELYAFLAANHLAQNRLETALEYALKAHDLAGRLGDMELIGLTWRMLGRVISQLPSQQRPVQIGDGRYDAASCFAKSLQLYETINGGGVASHRDQAHTLWYWAISETANGQTERAYNLQKRAEALARPLGLALV